MRCYVVKLFLLLLSSKYYHDEQMHLVLFLIFNIVGISFQVRTQDQCVARWFLVSFVNWLDGHLFSIYLVFFSFLHYQSP